MGGCTPEPRVVVVPQEGSPIDSVKGLASSTDNFDSDVSIQREAIVPGQVLSGTRYWYLAEVKNSSQSTAYQFRTTVDLFDDKGAVRGANTKSPDITVLPGETVLFLERVVDNLFPTPPSTIQSSIDVVSARAITEEQLGGLTIENLDWAVDTDYFGDRDFVVSGLVRNDTGVPVTNLRVDAWCQNSSGEIFAMPSEAFFGGDRVLAPGSAIPFMTDMYTEINMTVDECLATAIIAGPMEYGPGVDVNDLRDVTGDTP